MSPLITGLCRCGTVLLGKRVMCSSCTSTLLVAPPLERTHVPAVYAFAALALVALWLWLEAT